MATIIGQELGGYRIISQIGKGGMATVYKAFQPSLDRFVAVKVMPPYYAQEDETFIKRFKREAQSIAKLRHPNILLVIDFGEQDGLIYIVMEFVDAGTLTDQLGRPIPFNLTSKILEQVASALDYAHMQGLVHRDVKPSNILTPKPDWPLLTDFGLAKIVGGSQLTLTGTIAGTPAYMSPEQGQGESVDSRSDIYSLGIVLYEMTTGVVPYHAETPMAVVVKHIIDPLPLPSSKNPDLPESVEKVILKALAKNPDDRYQRANDLASAFHDAVGASLSIPTEAPTVVESSGFDTGVETSVEEPIVVEADVEAKVVTEKPPPVPVPMDLPPQTPPTEVETPSLVQAVRKPKKSSSWLKWLIPLGAGGAALCTIALAFVFIIVPLIQDGMKENDDIVPTLTAEQHYIEGQGYFEARDYEAAIPEYQAGINQGIEDPWIFLNLAESYKQVGRVEDAINIIEQVVQVAPEEAWVHESAAWFYQDLEFHREAIDEFEQAYELNPDGTHLLEGMADSYRAIGEYTKADEILGQGTRPDDDGDPYAFEEQGWSFLEDGNLDAAEEAFQKAIDIDPGVVGAWDGASEVALHREDFDKAIELLNTGIGFHPEDANLHRKLGWLHLQYGEFSIAEELFNKAIFLDSSMVEAWQGLADVYWYLDDMEAAIEVIETGIVANPESDDLFESLGLLLWESGDYEAAIAAFESSIDISPETSTAYISLSDLWYELGEDDQAFSTLILGLDRNPSRPDIHEALGYIYLDWEQYEDAIWEFEQARDLNPENPWMHLNLAFAYRMVNLWDQADEALREAEFHSKDDPWLLEIIAWEYVEMGNCEQALPIFDYVLDIDPFNEGAQDGFDTCSK